MKADRAACPVKACRTAARFLANSHAVVPEASDRAKDASARLDRSECGWTIVEKRRGCTDKSEEAKSCGVLLQHGSEPVEALALDEVPASVLRGADLLSRCAARSAVSPVRTAGASAAVRSSYARLTFASSLRLKNASKARHSPAAETPTCPCCFAHARLRCRLRIGWHCARSSPRALPKRSSGSPALGTFTEVSHAACCEPRTCRWN